ncbi:putative general secretion pathway protein H [Bradyrhizobium oligotrophicum S58]|uniref:Putative general secretion pathway protein H n=1 Tax=Bradyrhizobium oligotrophicum S58 TaxID=1245469 RepID=M4ZN36_9BRAD|nr:prepilin-type N-terminal cleavage/methylation domain-containing protein [Bradyrhizobium oligotrophicum]BAM87610.1 putative general secretion pathway protein H [Bradyrhizobium oligotrophicum S58]
MTTCRRSGCEAGFTLIEVVCVLAIVALLTAVLLPAIPRQTTRPRLEAYAVEAAALLKADRNAAIRRGREVTTRIDTQARAIRSGTNGEAVQFPNDVRFETLLPRSCDDRPAVQAISFFASGMSCGGVITLTHLDAGFEIRVNWLTGRIEIVSNADRSGR